MGQGQAAHSSPTDRASPRARDLLPFLASLVIGAAALFGGASRENALRLAIVELAALPLLALTVRRALREGGERLTRLRVPLTILALIGVVPLLQLCPLPPGLWTALPGQAPRLEALRLAHLPTPWLPLSLDPGETGRMALALIPPAAMFLGMASLRPGQTRALTWLWIALAAAGLVVGLAQVASPAGGPAYPYATTNLGSLVGLFANRNHEAGFLLALTPLAAAAARRSDLSSRQDASSRGWGDGRWLGYLFVLAAMVALGVIRSRAGLVLAPPAIAATLAVGARVGGRRSGWGPAAALAAAVAAAAVAVVVSGLGPIVDRFASGASGEFRLQAWPYIAAAARAFLPLGSGLGSFDRVFEAVEPLSLVAPAYFNHAHNDYLELWLETGWIGAAILALFALWFLAASVRAWRSGDDLARAASAGVVLLLAQSAVDYPLRTEALAVLFAFCCGLLASPDHRRR